MSNPATKHTGTQRCPICGAGGSMLLTLPAQPIYQHPVPADAVVEPPYTVDLSWLTCDDCAHAWQPHFDAGLLERIYQSHYYTPAPGGFAQQFRNDFLQALQTFGIDGTRRTLLEIGASDGDVLAELKSRLGANIAYAFEPNVDNAGIAQQRGLDVRRQFFGASAAQERMTAADLGYARHVIEHVFDFSDFFAGLNAVMAPGADLVLETPSLDFHAQQGTLDPFHVEHVHVFSHRSLARLASLHGWKMTNSVTTQDGNLIVAFKRGQADVTVPAPEREGLQRSIDQRHARWKDIAARKRLLFWGAGSSGVVLASIIGREPDVWTDGNPAKVGKRIVGLDTRIVSPKDAFAAIGNSKDAVLVIASAFVREILPHVRELGWQGDVLDAAGNRVP